MQHHRLRNAVDDHIHIPKRHQLITSRHDRGVAYQRRVAAALGIVGLYGDDRKPLKLPGRTNDVVRHGMIFLLANIAQMC